MDYSYGSSSEDLTDSQGLNNFLNAEDSSEEDIAFRKPNPYLDAKKKGNINSYSGDPYAFNMDFSNIKIPSKVQPKPKPQPVVTKPTPKPATSVPAKKGVSFGQNRPKSPEDDDKPIDMKNKQANSKFESMKKDFMSMMGSLKSSESASNTSKNSDSPAMPHLNVVN